MNLTKNQWEALYETLSHEKRRTLMWWRRTSLRQLEIMGLVEQWTPASVSERKRLKTRPYRLTASGRLALQGTEHDQ